MPLFKWSGSICTWRSGVISIRKLIDGLMRPLLSRPSSCYVFEGVHYSEQHRCVFLCLPWPKVPHDCWYSQVVNEANSRWQPSTGVRVNSSVLPPEWERRSGESRAEGTAFTLFHEGDTHVSDALERSDRLEQPSSLLCRKCTFTVCHM